MRLEGVAVAGFFPTPPHLISTIASVLKIIAPPKTGRVYQSSKPQISVMDPCAGDGEAVISLIKALVADDIRLAAVESELYACELEEGRAKELKSNAHEFHYGRNCLFGDAFQVTFSKTGPYSTEYQGVSLLYLNPPYDTDRVHGRLEQRFLDRFAQTLCDGGVLVFVVPFYALKASADLLGRDFTDVRCFRFPETDYAAYHQVVLYARKGPSSLLSDPRIVAQVQEWATNDASIPEFHEATILEVPAHADRGGLHDWKMREFDLTAILAKVQPWKSTTRGGVLMPIPGILPEGPVQDTLLRKFSVATPPRPAHIASGIASGLFNGARIEPKAGSKLPPLLVKGVFNREYRTIEEKRNKDGEVKALIQIQQPKLVTMVLDLRAHKYHVLASGTEATNKTEIEGMNVADLLNHYGDSLMGVMEHQCPVLYDPRRDAESIPLCTSPRKLFTAQAHASKAIVKLLGGKDLKPSQRRGKAAILLGEIGSGKSTVALMAGKTINAKRFLVMCPPHLLASWENEIASVVPGATVRVLSTIEDLHEASKLPASNDKPIICILSREAGKLTHGWEGVGAVCPKCGNSTPSVDLAKKRARCEYKKLIAQDDLARETRNFAYTLLPYAPGAHGIQVLLRGSLDKVREEREATEFPGLKVSSVDRALWLLLAQVTDNRMSDGVQKAIIHLLLASWSVDRVATVTRILLSSPDHRFFGQQVALLLPPGHAEQESLMIDFPRVRSYSWGNDDWTQFKSQIKTLSDTGELTWPVKMSWAHGVLRYDGAEANTIEASVKLLSFLTPLSNFAWGKECGEYLFNAVPEPRRVSIAKHITRYYRGLFDFLTIDECFVAGTMVSGRPIETIQVGDIVDSFDEKLRTVVQRKVTKLWRKQPTTLVRVYTSDGRYIVSTHNHPFWTTEGWVTADRLVGKELMSQEILGPTQDGSTYRTWVDRVEILERGSDGTFGGVCADGLVYNLEVEGTHTYFAEGVLVHNCHEYSAEGSAQERAAHRLTTLQIPTVLMTGTIMNGYAESLFANMWALSADFRREFDRDECSRFVDRFGYRKRLVEDRDKQSGEVIEFGSQSDRVTRSERIIGNAPGVLPLFILQHLLPISVTLHKKDLAIDLSPCVQKRHVIKASPKVQAGYLSLQTALVSRIRADLFKVDRAGKLFGQLAELPSYLDRASSDVGNVEGGDYEIRYPESLENELVAVQAGRPSKEILAKEEWMLDLVETELAEGRNVMVFSWHVGLLPRLARLIEERTGEKTPILYADKVPTAKRQAWIDKEVVKKGRRVLVTNPVCIQTGLNNLIHFASEVWMENPACNPVIFRQAIGRVDRIGQKLETRIHVAIYGDTLQVQMYDLLMKKVAVSVSTDGLDPEAALQAAGLGEDEYLAGLSIGKQLWAMIGGLDVEIAAAE